MILPRRRRSRSGHTALRRCFLAVAVPTVLGGGCAGPAPSQGPPSPPPPVGTEAPALEPYTVRPGDTLWSLARRHRTTVDALVAWNALEDPDRIAAGAILRVPPVEAPEPAAPPPREAAPADPAAESEPARTAAGARDGELGQSEPPDPPRHADEAAPSPAVPARASLARARSGVVDAELRFWAADYEASLEAAHEAHDLVASRDGAEARAVRARALLVAGMALGALGDEAEARAHFARALDEEPGIALPKPPPPRLEQLFEAARAGAGGAAPVP